MADADLSELERDALECCADCGFGETTTQLDEGLLKASPGRPALERVLRGLVARGLMTTSRGTFGGSMWVREGRNEFRIFEDDWWELTDAGRAAIGLPPRRK
jgi:hypothetical protein